MSAIHFESTYDDSKLRAGIKRSNQTVGEWAANAQRQGLVVERTFRQVQQAVAGYLSLRFASQIGKDIISIRGEFQQLNIALETMLGSKAKADQMMSGIIERAIKSPFTVKDIAGQTKQLMAMGIAVEDVEKTIKTLGDVAAGTSVPLSRLAINYGQVAALGKLQGREIRDFAMAGVPIVEELAKQFGKTTEEIYAMVEASKIGFKDVEKAFANMAGEGGKFYNLMEKQNASVTGQLSNLRDKIDLMMNDLGKANEGLIYSGIEGLGTLVEHYEDVIDVLKVLVTTYGSYKAAMIATVAVEKISVSAGAIKAWFDLARGIKTAKDAQIAFNLATKANPYAIAIAGIATLISVLSIFKRRQREAREEIEKEIKPLQDKYRQTNELIGKLKDSTKTEEERKKILEDLKKVNPDIVEGIKNEADSLELLTDRLKKFNSEQLAAMNVKEFSITGGFTDSAEELAKQTENLDSEKSKIIGTYTELFNRFNDLVRNNQDIPENVKTLFESIFQSNENVPQKVEALFAAYKSVQDRIKARMGQSASSPEQGAEERSVLSLFAGLDIKGYEKDLKRFDKANNEFISKSEELKRKIQDVGNAMFPNDESQREYWIESQMALYFPDENEVNKILEQYGNLFKKVSEYSKDQLQVIRDELSGLLGEGLGAGADQKIKSQISKIDERINAEKNKKRVVDVIDEEIKALKAKQSAVSENKKVWDEYAQKIAALEKEKAGITGVKNKDSEREIRHSERYLEIQNQIVEKQKELNDLNDQSTGFTPGSEESNANLEKRLSLLMEISGLEAQLAKVDPNTKIKPIAAKFVSKELNLQLAKNKELTAEQRKQLKLLDEKLNKIVEQQEQIEGISEGLRDSSELLDAAAFTFSQFNSDLGDAVSKMGDLAWNAATLVANLGTGGDPITAVSSGIAMLGNILNLFSSENSTDQINNSLEKINRTLEQQSSILAAMSDENWFVLATKQVKDYEASIIQLGETLKTQVDGYSSETYDRFLDRYNEYVNQYNQLYQKTEVEGRAKGYEGADLANYVEDQIGILQTFNEYIENNFPLAIPANMWDFETIYKQWAEGKLDLGEDAIDTLKQIYNAIDEIERLTQKQQMSVLGFDAESVSNSLVDGIINGKRAAEGELGDLADTFGDLMESAGRKSLEAFINEQYLSDFYQKAYEFAKSNGIDEDEQEKLRELYQEMAQGAQDYYDSISNLFNSKINQQANQGTRVGATEESVSLLFGQITAARVDIKGLRENSDHSTDYLMQSVKHLAGIEKNTGYNKHLESIDQKLGKLDDIVSRLS